MYSKILFALASLALCMISLFMMGKFMVIMLDDGKFGHLQKCPEVAAKLGNDLRGYKY